MDDELLKENLINQRDRRMDSRMLHALPLDRPDIWPVKDLGLQMAVKK